MSGIDGWWETPSQEREYLFGFAFADGAANVNRRTGGRGTGLTIYQSGKDRDILDQIAGVSPGGRIYKTGNKDLWALYFGKRDGLTAHILGKWGLVPNKTENGYWPEVVSIEYLTHYMRGFFDGDGWIYGYRHKGKESISWSIGFVCHLHDYLQRLRELLELFGVVGGRLVSDRGNYRLIYSRHGEIEKFVSTIYQDSTIYLKRKRLVALDFLRYRNMTRGMNGKVFVG